MHAGGADRPTILTGRADVRELYEGGDALVLWSFRGQGSGYRLSRVRRGRPVSTVKASFEISHG